jgi:hypothetical protein
MTTQEARGNPAYDSAMDALQAPEGVAFPSRSGARLYQRQGNLSKPHNPNEEGPWQTR